jgi:acetyltransferase-like isoleucine patch superfamily enzyme
LKLIPFRKKLDIHRELIPMLLDEGISIHTYKTDGYWNPIDNFKDYQRAQNYLLRNRHRRKNNLKSNPSLKGSPLNGVQISPGIWIAGNNQIHPSARFAPPVYIANNCRICRDVEIGPEVVVSSNVIIDDEASISRSTVLDHTYVGRLVNIENRLVYQDHIVDIETGDHIRITDEFLLGPIYESDVNSGLKRASDILISAIMIFITLPISILVALLVFLQTGHLFRKVERQSYDHQFTVLKFLTRDLNGNPIRMGRWIELFELDRLPEFMSVLKGDMSMTGVKPLSPEDEKQANEAWQQRRFDSKPGYTGLLYIQTSKISSLFFIFWR